MKLAKFFGICGDSFSGQPEAISLSVDQLVLGYTAGTGGLLF